MLALFLQLIRSNFRLKLCERSRSYQNFKRNKLEGFFVELEIKTFFQRQSFAKKLRLTLVFILKSNYRKSLIFIFQFSFPSGNKTLFLESGLGASLSFWDA